MVAALGAAEAVSASRTACCIEGSISIHSVASLRLRDRTMGRSSCKVKPQSPAPRDSAAPTSLDRPSPLWGPLGLQSASKQLSMPAALLFYISPELQVSEAECQEEKSQRPTA